jgi:hypothetical protein
MSRRILPTLAVSAAVVIASTCWADQEPQKTSTESTKPDPAQTTKGEAAQGKEAPSEETKEKKAQAGAAPTDASKTVTPTGNQSASPAKPEETKEKKAQAGAAPTDGSKIVTPIGNQGASPANPKLDRVPCTRLSAYPIGRSGIVRVTWPQLPESEPKTAVSNVRYTLLRGTLTTPPAPVAHTAYHPVTNVVLDQVPTNGLYVYQLQVDIIDPTGATKPISAKSQQKTVNTAPRQATTLIAETFDGNRIDPNHWKGPLTSNWKIEDGLLILGAKVQMPVQPVIPPGYTLSKNGLDIVARVKVTSDSHTSDTVDEIAAAIGFETNDPSDPAGYILKLALRQNCGSRKVQLQFTKKNKPGAPSNDPVWFPLNAQAPEWEPGQFIWLKLKVNTETTAPSAVGWAWKDGADAPEFDDDKAGVFSFDFSANGLVKEGSLTGTPTLYGEAGTASFGELIIQDLNRAPGPAAAAVTTPTAKPAAQPGSQPSGHVSTDSLPPTNKASETRVAKVAEPPPPLGFCHHWPNSAVEVSVHSETPSGRWKLSQRGLSVKPIDRTIEDDIRLITADGSSDGFSPADPDQPASADADFQKTPDHLFLFLGPAMFPRLRFQGVFLPPFEDDGATIRESMNLRARDDGRFEVEFFVIAQPLQVTLRLQLELHRGSHDYGRITLPPIVLDPRNFGRDEIQADTWRVVYHGYSRALAEVLNWRSPDTRDPIEITRHGAARFGSGVDAVGSFDDM